METQIEGPFLRVFNGIKDLAAAGLLEFYDQLQFQTSALALCNDPKKLTSSLRGNVQICFGCMDQNYEDDKSTPGLHHPAKLHVDNSTQVMCVERMVSMCSMLRALVGQQHDGCPHHSEFAEKLHSGNIFEGYMLAGLSTSALLLCHVDNKNYVNEKYNWVLVASQIVDDPPAWQAIWNEDKLILTNICYFKKCWSDYFQQQDFVATVAKDVKEFMDQRGSNS